MGKINLPRGTKLFASENLNRYFQKLGWLCRKLLRGKLISSYTYRNESFVIKYELEESNMVSKKITSESVLFKLFPDFFSEEER